MTVAGTVVAVAVLAAVVAGDRAEFSDALSAAPLVVLIGAAALQAVALVSRSEAWHASVRAAGALAFAAWAIADGLLRRRRPALPVRAVLPRPVAFAVPLEERP